MPEVIETIENPDEPKSCIKPRAWETQQLYKELLRRAEAKDYSIATYEELSVVASADTQNEARGHLRTARNAVEREKNCLFGCVHSQGIKLLTVQEQASEAGEAIAATRRQSQRSLKRLSRVEFDELTPEAQEQHKVASVTLGMTLLFSRKSGQKKLAGIVTQSPKTPRIGETLALFASRNGKTMA